MQLTTCRPPSGRATSSACWPRPPLAALYTLVTLLTLASAPAQAQWTPLASGTTASLRGLSVVDGQIVWASGTRGTVVHTTDGGDSWRVDTVPGASGLDFRAVHARSARVAHVAATAGRIYRTLDGGASWSLRYQARDTAVFLDAIAFWDDRHGLALGDPIDGHYVLVFTDDGGASWRELPVAQRPRARAGEAAFAASGSSLLLIGAADSLEAWIGSGGSAARAHHGTARLQQWDVYDTPMRQGESSTGIFSLATVPGGGFLVVGGHYAQDDSTRGNVARSRDGRRWERIDGAPPRGYRSGVAFVQRSDGLTVGLAVGPAGSDVSVDGGARWAPFDRVGYHAVRSSSDGIFFASGSGGRLARFSAHLLRPAP